MGSRAWWNTVNSITGRKSYCQSISSIIDPDTINTYFAGINTDLNYSAPEPVTIPEDAKKYMK